MAQRLALIIGNSVFRDQTLARLLKPDADVGALADVLLDKEIGDFNDVKLLVNMSSTQVRRAISNFYSKKQRDDLLLLYFSGHGVLDDQGRLHLAVKDTERALLRATAIPAAYVTEEMNNSHSRRQVLILDCCHSGAFARGSKGATGASVGTATAFEGTGFGRLVLTATDATQYAWEGDQVIGEAENSVFTHYLIQGLKTGQADSDGDGRITVDELYDYTYEQVVHSTPKQTPGKWSYREQGEIVIAHASGTVGIVQTPSPLPDIDDERDRKVKQFYNKGLAAYYLKEWDKSVTYFKAVLEVHPDHQEAASKLEEAQQQARLNELYDQAQLALETEDWGKALIALETLTAENPDFKDAISLFEYASRQKKLSDMYEEARQLHNAQEWQAVVSVFSEINALDPDYPDQEGFLASAQKQVILLEQRRKLEKLYSSALEAMETADWDGAHQLFIQVMEIDSSYEDAQRLSKLAEEEIQRQESAHQQALLIASLYQEAIDYYNAGDWGVALSKLDEILRLDPDFSDPDDIRTRAQTRAQEEQRLADQFSQALEHLETQHWSQAIETFQDILKNDPEYNDPTYGSAATLLNRAKQEKERSELPPPPIKKSTKPSTLPEVRKPTGKPKDLPR
jgi:tetratricopeptide (TPR) repeat protein